jgi:aryl-alcohol dehydrogenase-like predicted oxidoreductase
MKTPRASRCPTPAASRCGTKRRGYLEENAAAADLKLTESDLRRLQDVFPSGAAAGLRYPEHMMNLVNA